MEGRKRKEFLIFDFGFMEEVERSGMRGSRGRTPNVRLRLRLGLRKQWAGVGRRRTDDGVWRQENVVLPQRRRGR